MGVVTHEEHARIPYAKPGPRSSDQRAQIATRWIARQGVDRVDHPAPYLRIKAPQILDGAALVFDSPS